MRFVLNSLLKKITYNGACVSIRKFYPAKKNKTLILVLVTEAIENHLILPK